MLTESAPYINGLTYLLTYCIHAFTVVWGNWWKSAVFQFSQFIWHLIRSLTFFFWTLKQLVLWNNEHVASVERRLCATYVADLLSFLMVVMYHVLYTCYSCVSVQLGRTDCGFLSDEVMCWTFWSSDRLWAFTRQVGCHCQGSFLCGCISTLI